MAAHHMAVMPDDWLDRLKNRDALHFCVEGQAMAESS
jgi:hypothetical protein